MPQRKKATLQVIENAAFLYCYLVEMGGVEPPSASPLPLALHA